MRGTPRRSSVRSTTNSARCWNTIDDAADDSGWASLGDVGSVLSKKMPDFDPRNYGYKKLSLLVRALSDAVDMKTEQQRVYVRNRVG